MRFRRANSVLLRAQLALLLAIFGAAAGASARAQIAVVGDGGPGPVKAQHLTAELVALGPAIAPGGTQQVGLRTHTGQRLARLLDQPWRLGRAAADRVDAARGRYRRADAVSHSAAAAAGPADGLRLRGRGCVSRDDCGGPDAEAGAGASGCAGELAGVRRGLHSRQGAPGNRTSRCSLERRRGRSPARWARP